MNGLYMDILRLVELYHDLEDAAVSVSGGGLGGGSVVSGTRDRGLKYNPLALGWMDQVRMDLWMNLRLVGMNVSHGDAISVMCKLLSERVSALGKSKDAGAARSVFRELVVRGMHILQPVRRPAVVGECPGSECGGELVVVMDGANSTLGCDTCKLSIPPAKWAKFGVRHGYVGE
jgi:hypothetical protein